jgi:hypothetical protein
MAKRMKLFGKHCTGMLAILAFPGMVTCADVTLPPPDKTVHQETGQFP